MHRESDGIAFKTEGTMASSKHGGHELGLTLIYVVAHSIALATPVVVQERRRLVPGPISLG